MSPWRGAVQTLVQAGGGEMAKEKQHVISRDLGVNDFNITGPVVRKSMAKTGRGTERVRIDVQVKHPRLGQRQNRPSSITVTFFGPQALALYREVREGDIVSCKGYVNTRLVNDSWEMYLHGRTAIFLHAVPRREQEVSQDGQGKMIVSASS